MSKVMCRSIVIVIVLVCVFGIDAFAVDLTFKANWNNGSSTLPDVADHMVGWTNDGSFWEADVGDSGHMNLRGFEQDAGGGWTRNKPWSNYEKMRNDLSADGFTIKFWFKPEEPEGAFFGLLFNWEDWDDNFYGGHPLLIEGSFFGSTFKLIFGDQSLGSYHTHTEIYSMSNGSWYHIAFVVDLNANVSSIYINGNQVGTNAGLGIQSSFNPGLTYGNEGRFVIAGRHKVGLTDLEVGEGDYDQFEVYDGPLSPGEILANYNEGRIPLIPLTITTISPLPAGDQGDSYSFQLDAIGYQEAPAWNIIAGSLPAGLNLSTDGLISGIPTTAETKIFTIQATSGAETDSKQFQLTVNPGDLEIASTSPLPDGAVGKSYSQTLTAQGGSPGYRWWLVAGSLPSGLSLSIGGVISGNPTTEGISTFTVEVHDSVGDTDQKQFDIEIIDESPSSTAVLGVSWLPETDKRYSVYSSDALDSGNWLHRFSLDTGTSGSYTWYDEGDTFAGIVNPVADTVPRRFYKILSDTATEAVVAKKLIQWGWGMPYPTFMLDNIDTMEQMPFDGVNIRIPVPPPGDEFLSKSMFLGVNITYGMVETEAQALQQVNFNKFTHNFLSLRTSASLTTVEWFEDFSTVLNNFTLAGKIAYEGGLVGCIIDPEHYGATLPLFSYPDRKYTSKTWEEYEAQVFLRGQQIMQAINSEFPDPIIFFPHSYNAPYNEVKTRDGLDAYWFGLIVPFVDGMVAASSPETRFLLAMESSYQYRTEPEFIAGYQFQRDAIEALSIDPQAILDKVSIGFGIWLRSSDTPEEWHDAVTYALQYADEYAWVYTQQMKWWDTPEMSLYPFVPPSFIDAQRQAHPFDIVNQWLNKGIIGQPYSDQLLANTGRTPYRWSIASGALPDGIGLNSGTGSLSGAPTTVGNSSFVVLVTDNSGDTATESLSIEVVATFEEGLEPAVKVEWNSLPGDQYRVQWSADGVSGWQTISPVIIGTGGASTFYDTGDTSSRPEPWFRSPPLGRYRVITLP